jgi:vacuolar-type H+-ATPase subunit I/STV1
MIRDNLHTFYLKITTLSPLHIGTGEVYEPSSFVIDDGKLFQFDEVLFYQSLSSADKREFGQKSANWMSIIDFYRSKSMEAKRVAKFICSVSPKVEQTYKKLRNADGTKKQNQFQIAETFKNPNTHRAVIPGSSIKGMLDTVLKIYARKVTSNEPRQRLILSDAMLLNGKSEIGYSYRKHKHPSKIAKSEIPQMVEIVSMDSTFVLTITTEYSFKQIQEMMKAYHDDRRDSEYAQTTNSFVARVGKFCGKEYMVDDGKNVLNSYDKPIATHTLYESGDGFGWINMEQITKDEYSIAIESIASQEKEYYTLLEEKQKDIVETITAQKEEQKRLKQEKEESQKAKEKLEQDAKEKREREVASMTPLEKKIDELVENDKNTPKSTLLFTAIKNNQFENERLEALETLKSLLIEEKKWKESSTAKKPEKDKVYKRTLEIIKMIKS